MRIPFANRTADVDLPVSDGQARVTVKAVIDDFKVQMPENFSDVLEAFVLLSPRLVRVTCGTARNLEEFCNLGLTFRGSPVIARPCRTAKWVNLTRLSYGVPVDTIIDALRSYGNVLHVKMDLYQGVYVGVCNILMELSNPIPSSIRVADHWCNVFYPGQVPTCFLCRETGHTRSNCPGSLIPPPVGEPTDTSAPSNLPVFAPPTTTVATTESSLVGPTVLPAIPTAKPSYASAVRSGLLPDPP